MITRPSFRPHQIRSRQQHSQPKQSTTPLSLSRTSSRPGTPPRSRGDLASRKSSSNICDSSQPMADQPVTPTPKKPDRRKRGGAPSSVQRTQAQAHGERVQPISDEDEETLFDLLGVTSPAPAEEPRLERGILPVSKDVREKGRMQKGTRRRKGHQVAESEPERGGLLRGDLLRMERGRSSSQRQAQAGMTKSEDRGVMSEGEVRKGRAQRSRRAIQPLSDHLAPTTALLNPDGVALPAITGTTEPSGISKTRLQRRRQAPASAESTPLPIVDGAFDLSLLSRSLPSESFLAPKPQHLVKTRSKKGQESEDESAVWEMPDVLRPSEGRELTVCSVTPSSTSLIRSSGSKSCRTAPTPLERAPNPIHPNRMPKPAPSPKPSPSYLPH